MLDGLRQNLAHAMPTRSTSAYMHSLRMVGTTPRPGVKA